MYPYLLTLQMKYLASPLTSALVMQFFLFWFLMKYDHLHMLLYKIFFFLLIFGVSFHFWVSPTTSFLSIFYQRWMTIYSVLFFNIQQFPDFYYYNALMKILETRPLFSEVEIAGSEYFFFFLSLLINVIKLFPSPQLCHPQCT